MGGAGSYRRETMEVNQVEDPCLPLPIKCSAFDLKEMLMVDYWVMGLIVHIVIM